jgi:neutral amino acid transport system permease protein
MDTSQLIFNGIAVGSIIALSAVGLTLTYGILKLSNFAHGDFMTLGAYLTWVFNRNGMNIWLAMILGALGTVGGMLLTEQLLWKPMRDRRASPTTLIIISIGLALFIRNGILLIWGGSNQRFDLPIAEALEIGGIKIAYYRIIVVILAILAVTALHFIFQFSKIGKAMRAVADNIDLARVLQGF